MELFITVFAALFSVVNPIGAIPVFLSLTPEYTKAERNRTALMTGLYFIGLSLIFFLAGSTILSFFGISLPALTIAGGLIIMNSGFSLMKGKFAESRAIDKQIREEAMDKPDISFTPMAMPMLSGPGSISLLISLFSTYTLNDQRATIAGVVVVTGAVVYLMLRTSPYLFKLLGRAGIRAISRIMGFLVVAIGIQYIANGIMKFIELI